MSIPTLALAPNGFYYAFWSEGRRSKRKSMGTRSEADAKARFAQWLLIGGQSEGPVADITVAEMWAAYREGHEVAAPKTLDAAWKNLEPHFGPLLAPEIDQKVVDRYEAARTSGRIGQPSKPVTIRRELTAMRACMNWCAHSRRRILDPAAIPDFDLPPDSEPRDRWLRSEEIDRLLAGAAKLRRGDRLARVEIFLWLALETAARAQAILELTWDRVDFETNVIHYNVPGRKTTKKRRSDVPISKALRAVLLRAYEERENNLVVMNGSSIWASVQWAAMHAGFGSQGPVKRGTKPKATGVSPHVLRHTAATHMARNGVPLWKIAKILGNSLAMVEKVYAKHAPDDLRDAVDGISNGRPIGN